MQNNALLIQDYLPLLTKSGVTMTKSLPPTNTPSNEARLYNWANSDDSSNNTNEDNSPSASECLMVSPIEDITGVLELGNLDDTIFGFDELNSNGNLLYETNL